MFFNISNNAKKFEYIQFKNRIRSVTKDFLPQRKHILQNYIPFLAIYLYFSPLIELISFSLENIQTRVLRVRGNTMTYLVAVLNTNFVLLNPTFEAE